MPATWDEPKRRANLRRHGLDFADAESIWDNFTVTLEDVRLEYGEARWVCFGVVAVHVVVLVYVERHRGPHFISLRKATAHEKRAYLQAAKNHFR